MHNNANKEAVSQRLSSMGKRFFHYVEFDQDEQLVLEIRKHPFGLLLIEVIGFVVSTLVAVSIIGLAMFLDDLELVTDPGLVSSLQPFVVMVGLVVGVLGIGITFLIGWLYSNNVIFITSEKIAQVLYTSLLNRKVSQLSIGDVQDVTVSQKGIFSRLFRYGTLVIETAGEQQNYTFTYVPDPYGSGQAIVGTHEENLKQYGN